MIMVKKTETNNVFIPPNRAVQNLLWFYKLPRCEEGSSVQAMSGHLLTFCNAPPLHPVIQCDLLMIF